MIFIKKKTILDLSEIGSNFFEFSQRVSTNSNYSVSLISKAFKYEKGTNTLFNLDLLQEIFPDNFNDIEGSIVPINFKESADYINLCFACGGGASGDGKMTQLDLRMAPEEEVEQRLIWFWSEIEKYIQVPPTHAYKHIPKAGSYFDGGIFWQFCFIYLNEQTQQGFLIAGECFD